MKPIQVEGFKCFDMFQTLKLCVVGNMVTLYPQLLRV